MKKIVILLNIMVSVVCATVTETTFNTMSAPQTDKYGNTVYEQSVTIKTKDFKVDNFWDNFHKEGTAQSNFSTISKTGLVQIIASSTSICTLHPELDSQGCSGQKPFLINNEALDSTVLGDTITLLFQKDFDLETQTILYTDTNASVFYPLDIDRTEKYYKSQTDNTKSFFGFFSSMFNMFFGDADFFGGFFSFAVVDNTNMNVEDIRQRYIANIISGVDEEHLLESGKTALETTSLNNPVSLIDYSEDMSSGGTCSFFFFTLPEDSSFCSMMSGMPFISMFTSSTPETNYVIDTIQVDTENALISFAGEYAELTVTQYQSGTVYEKQSESTGMIVGMIDMMKCMFFGCSEKENVEDPMDSFYEFNEDNAINITMAVTNDGDKIDGFETFKLMGIHSLTGNQHSCTVKESNWDDKWDEHTFKAGDSDTITTTETITVIDEPAVTCGWFSFGCTPVEEVSHEEEVTTTTDIGYSAKSMDEGLQSSLGIDSDGNDILTSSEWLDWCSYMADKYIVSEPVEVCTTTWVFFFPITTCEWVTEDTMAEDGYEITAYTNESKRGLLLDLQRTQLHTHDKAITLDYRLMNTSN